MIEITNISEPLNSAICWSACPVNRCEVCKQVEVPREKDRLKSPTINKENLYNKVSLLSLLIIKKIYGKNEHSYRTEDSQLIYTIVKNEMNEGWYAYIKHPIDLDRIQFFLSPN